MNGGGRFRDSDALAILERLVEDPERTPTLRALAGLARTAARADRATVFALDETRGTLVGLADLGTDEWPIEVPLGRDSIAGFCALERRAVRVGDARGDLSAVDPRLRFCDRIDLATGYRTRSVCAVPVVSRDRVIGVVEAINATDGTFTAADEERLDDLAAVAGIVLSVSRLFEDVREMRQVERRKSDFIDLLVHELKEPLAAIQMLAEFGLEQEADPDARAKLLERIAVRTGQVTTLVSELLQVSRIKRGAVLGRIGPVDLADTARRAAAAVEEMARLRSVSVELRIDSGLPPVRIDDGLVPWLFGNLLSNALKYTDGGGRVTIALHRDDDGVRCEVQDTGIGVPADELRLLFREFYRATNARARGVDGTGLGLVAVKEIAERFGGRVGAESTLGRGSRFWVWLPAAR
jgi:signal transduction histidine kinase